MANKIQVKRGPRAKLPTLSVGEFGFCTDTLELFIGSSSGNIPLANLNHGHEFPHDHGETYYTKTEVDTELNKKSGIIISKTTPSTNHNLWFREV